MSFMRKNFYKFISRWVHFDLWHVTPIDERPYAMCAVQKINRIIKKYGVDSGDIVEIGCGLGDCVSAICYPPRHKYGYDIDKKVICVAKFVHPKTKFKVGSFSEVVNHNIFILLCLNFLHIIEPSVVSEYLSKVIKENKIRFIIVDVVESPPYQYSHDWNTLFSKFSYVRVYTSRRFSAYGNSGRRILIFERKC